MKTYFKTKPFKSQRYKRDVVRLIPCVASGSPADDPHHIKGIGGGTGAKDDRLIIPLTRKEHTLFHHNPKLWEARNGKQIDHCRDVLSRVRELGILEKRPDLIDEAEQMLDELEKRK